MDAFFDILTNQSFSKCNYKCNKMTLFIRESFDSVTIRRLLAGDEIKHFSGEIEHFLMNLVINVLYSTFARHVSRTGLMINHLSPNNSPVSHHYFQSVSQLVALFLFQLVVFVMAPAWMALTLWYIVNFQFRLHQHWHCIMESDSFWMTISDWVVHKEHCEWYF